MEKDILSQVIEAEKEIQKCLDAEKLTIRDWIAEVRKDVQEEFLLEEKKLKTSKEESLAEERGEAERKAREILAQASSSVERLKHVEKEMLTRIIERQLTRILPG